MGTYCFDTCPEVIAAVGVRTVPCDLSTSPVSVDDAVESDDAAYSQYVVSASILPLQMTRLIVLAATSPCLSLSSLMHSDCVPPVSTVPVGYRRHVTHHPCHVPPWVHSSKRERAARWVMRHRRQCD